jgi:hypothetical protein
MGNCVNTYYTRSKLGVHVIWRLYWTYEFKKIIPLNAVKAFWGSEDILQCILELGTK